MKEYNHSSDSFAEACGVLEEVVDRFNQQFNSIMKSSTCNSMKVQELEELVQKYPNLLRLFLMGIVSLSNSLRKVGMAGLDKFHQLALASLKDMPESEVVKLGKMIRERGGPRFEEFIKDVQTERGVDIREKIVGSE